MAIDRFSKGWFFVTTEAVPFFKHGGLGDYVFSIGGAMVEAGMRPVVILPLYEEFVAPEALGEDGEEERAEVTFKGENVEFRVLSRVRCGIRYCLVKCPRFWGAGGIAAQKCEGYNRNLDKYTFLGKCAASIIASFCRRETWAQAVAQGNDWYSSFFAPYLQDYPLSGTRLVKLFCIHNFNDSYRGKIYPNDFPNLDAPLQSRLAHEAGADTTWSELLWPHYDRLSTVSPSYAKQLAEGERQANAALAARMRKGEFRGFLNGIRRSEWNFPHGQGSPEPEALMTGKAEALQALAPRLGLDPAKPLVAFIGRLCKHKGLEYMGRLASRMPGISVVILGSGDKLENHVRSEDIPFLTHISVYSESICRSLLAAAHYLVIPSDQEPCGYVAMYAAVYGAFPLCKANGGLLDIGAKVAESTGEDPFFSDFDTLRDSLREKLERGLHLDGKIPYALSKLDWGWGCLPEFIAFAEGRPRIGPGGFEK